MREFTEGQVAVRFHSGVPRWRADDLCRTVRAQVRSFQELDNSYVVDVPVGSEEDAAQRLSASPYVVYAERVGIDRVVLPVARR